MGKSTYTIKSYILMLLQFTLMQFWCSAFTVKKMSLGALVGSSKFW